MPDEIVHWLGEPKPNVIVDGTFGGGGHSKLLLDVLPEDGRIIALDRDPQVSRRAETENLDPRISLFIGSYEKTGQALEASEIAAADAMVLDLGLSSDQLADRERGFSFQHDGPLDLRFDAENGMSASQWLQRHSETEIANAIYQFGEERFSRRIAKAIVHRRRNESPVKTVGELVQICRSSVPRGKNHDIHPATRTFQALRIAVNDELGALTRSLQKAPEWLSVGGRLAVISFHSLEDRIVKQAFRDDPRWDVLTNKPLRPTEQEVSTNPRSRSAKLRVAVRVG